MGDIQWIKIRAWHAFVTWTRTGGGLTRCGRTTKGDAEVRDALPAEKSCETCLRIVARLQDA